MLHNFFFKNSYLCSSLKFAFVSLIITMNCNSRFVCATSRPDQSLCLRRVRADRARCPDQQSQCQLLCLRHVKRPLHQSNFDNVFASVAARPFQIAFRATVSLTVTHLHQIVCARSCFLPFGARPTNLCLRAGPVQAPDQDICDTCIDVAHVHFRIWMGSPDCNFVFVPLVARPMACVWCALGKLNACHFGSSLLR